MKRKNANPNGMPDIERYHRYAQEEQIMAIE